MQYYPKITIYFSLLFVFKFIGKKLADLIEKMKCHNGDTIMRKIFFCFTVLSILLNINFLYAGEIMTTIRWEVDDDTNVDGYTIYYSVDPSMSNKQVCGTVDNPLVKQFKVNILNVNSNRVYFSVESKLSDLTVVESAPSAYVPPTKNLRVVN